MRRDRRAGDQQIGKRAEDRPQCSNLLDRITQSNRFNHRQAKTHGKEKQPGNKPDMQPGDRQQMRQPGIPHICERFLGN